MIVTFCGHRDLIITAQIEYRLTNILIDLLKTEDCVFYLGGYGAFDGLCNGVLRKLQKAYPTLKRIFITPYQNPDYEKLKTAKQYYDEIIFPFEQPVLPKFAILKRNEWMVDNSDLVVACVNLGWGGAYNTLAYAKKRGKTFVNIGSKNF